MIKLDIIKEMLLSMSKDSRYYWIKVLYSIKDISLAEAGYLVKYTL